MLLLILPLFILLSEEWVIALHGSNKVIARYMILLKPHAFGVGFLFYVAEIKTTNFIE